MPRAICCVVELDESLSVSVREIGQQFRVSLVACSNVTEGGFSNLRILYREVRNLLYSIKYEDPQAKHKAGYIGLP